MKKIVAHCVAIVFFTSISWFTAYSQCDTNQKFGYLMVSGTDTISNISVIFHFEMVYDSNRTMYRITEFKKNGSRVRLHGWCDEKEIKDQSDSSLTESSRTENISVVTGDTLSLYRELLWYNPVTSEMFGNYYSQDSLDFAVELIDVSNGSRLELLDSIGVLRQIPGGSVSLHGTRPLMSMVKFGIPSGMNGKIIFIRVRPMARGDGSNYFLRYDNVIADLSGRLRDSVWIAYNETYGTGLGNRAIKNLGKFDDATTILNSSPNPSSGDVSFAFSGEHIQNKPLTLAIYDMTGRLVFIPYSTRMFSGTGKATYRFEQNGDYLIVLQQGTVLVKAMKLTINK